MALKNRLALLMAGTMIICSLTACGGATSTTKGNTIAETTRPEDNTTAEATTESLAESDWYQGVLRDQSTKDHYSFHQLKDINGDDFPELFLSTTEADFIIFTLDEGELTPAGTADYYASFHDPNEENKEANYYLDGEKVSKDDCNSFYTQNADDSMVITYVTIP